MRKIWMARHGNREDFVDPDWHATADRPHDPDLSPDGVVQARQLGERVAALDVDGVIASPFLRTVRTAHLVAEESGHAVHLEPGLGEWMNPTWFDSAPDPLPPATLAEAFDRLVADVSPCVRPSFPETKAESFERIGTAVRCLVERHADASLLLVGHGITVQGALMGLLGDVPDEGCPLASLTTVVRRNGAWTIERRNDTSHLTGGAQSSDRLN
jgi:broad specificity phosphatase PhoE